MKSITKLLLAPCMAALLALTVPAAAQQQEGLINVNVSDIDVGVIANVQVPVAIAATVCGVAVNVLAEQLPGDVQCEADAETEPPSHCIRTLSDGVENLPRLRPASQRNA